MKGVYKNRGWGGGHISEKLGKKRGGVQRVVEKPSFCKGPSSWGGVGGEDPKRDGPNGVLFGQFKKT